jgi:hypothetical protein
MTRFIRLRKYQRIISIASSLVTHRFGDDNTGLKWQPIDLTDGPVIADETLDVQ